MEKKSFYRLGGLMLSSIFFANSKGEKPENIYNVEEEIKKQQERVIKEYSGIEIKDLETSLSFFDEESAKVIGQNKAKKEIRKKVIEIIDDFIYFNERFPKSKDKKNKNANQKDSVKGGPGLCILYLVGPSRCGKSYMAEIIAKTLLGEKGKVFSIGPKDIVAMSKSEDGKVSFSDAIFKHMKCEYTVRSAFKQPTTKVFYKETNATVYAQNFPQGVILIDDIDKEFQPNLENSFRSLIDNKGIYRQADGRVLDLTGQVIIITSNEKINKFAEDKSGTRTNIKKDKSFDLRLKKIEFEHLSADSLKKILSMHIKDKMKEFYKRYHCNVEIDEKSLTYIAEALEKTYEETAHIDDYVTSVYSSAVSFMYDKKIKKGSKLLAKYDSENNDFIIEKV